MISDSDQYNYDHLAYIRLFEGCNLSCDHCFIPANPKKIDLSWFENNRLSKELLKNGVEKGSLVYLQWHGGEPTLLGVDYLREAIKQAEASDALRFKHGIQTNLLNYHNKRSEWSELYHNHFNGLLGVSWDVDIRKVKGVKLSSQERVKEYNEIFWSNVSLAKEDGLSLYMVITVTKVFFERYKNPLSFFEEMLARGINAINLERITKTGMARENWDTLGLNNAEYSESMSRFFKFYYLFKKNNPNVKFNISPFDGLMNSVVDLKKSDLNTTSSKLSTLDMMGFSVQNGYGCWSGKCDTKFHTIDAMGYRSGCTAINSEVENSNPIFKNKAVSIINLKSKKDILNQRESRKANCASCNYNTICSSGCLAVNMLDESGECSGGKGLFQTIDKMVNL